MKPLIKVLLVATPTLFIVAEAHAVLTWARPYDPNLGRWIQRDPIGEQGGLNLYAYVDNNPIMGRDPYGLDNIYNMKAGNNAPPSMTISFSPKGGPITVQYNGGGLNDPLFLLTLAYGPPGWTAFGLGEGAATMCSEYGLQTLIGVGIGSVIYHNIMPLSMGRHHMNQNILKDSLGPGRWFPNLRFRLRPAANLTLA